VPAVGRWNGANRSRAAFCLRQLAKMKDNIPTLTIKPVQMLQYSDQRSTEIWNIYSGLGQPSYVHIYKWQLTFSEKITVQWVWAHENFRAAINPTLHTKQWRFLVLKIFPSFVVSQEFSKTDVCQIYLQKLE